MFVSVTAGFGMPPLRSEGGLMLEARLCAPQRLRYMKPVNCLFMKTFNNLQSGIVPTVDFFFNYLQARSLLVIGSRKPKLDPDADALS
mmetsp:Transcript_21421/g.38418  ORF Transcript_21421/g.38418 Transcript_21421/m.38418 type:complete len:88 (+) Transcript_21421:973-1236(+)